MVQGCGQSCSVARLSYARADNGGEGRTVKLCTAPGGKIPIYIKSFQVDDSIPEEGEIKWAVKRLRNKRSGGTSGMREEHVKH